MHTGVNKKKIHVHTCIKLLYMFIQEREDATLCVVVTYDLRAVEHAHYNSQVPILAIVSTKGKSIIEIINIISIKVAMPSVGTRCSEIL